MADREQIDFDNLESFEYLTENLPNGDIKYYRQTVRINPHDSLQYPRDIFSKSIMDTVEVTKEDYDLHQNQT